MTGLASKTWLALLALSTWASPVLAQEEASQTVEMLPGSDLLGSSISMVLGLGGVLLVMFALLWLMKKFQPGLVPQMGRGDMKILARLPLGGKASLIMVEAGGEVLLLGISENGVNLIKTLEGVTPEGLKKEPGFAGILQKARGKDDNEANA